MNYTGTKAAFKQLRNDLAVVYCDLKEETETWDTNSIEVQERDEIRPIDTIEILRRDCYETIETLEKIESL